jgi:hypothetical protein
MHRCKVCGMDLSRDVAAAQAMCDQALYPGVDLSYGALVAAFRTKTKARGLKMLVVSPPRAKRGKR